MVQSGFRLAAFLILGLTCSASGFSQSIPRLSPSLIEQISQQAKNQKPIKFEEPIIFHLQVMNLQTGELLRGFRADDFEVYEDGIKRQIVWFGHDQRPRSIVLLLDTRDLRPDELERLKTGLRESLSHLNAEDEIALLMLSEHAIPLLEFSRDRRLLNQKIDQVLLRKNSSPIIPAQLGKALLEASEYLRTKSAHNTQRMLISITENEELFRLKDRQLLDDLLRSESVICGVLGKKLRKRDVFFLALSSAAGVPPLYDAMNLRDARKRLQSYRVALNSGGEVVPMEYWYSGPPLAELLQHLERRYSLGYIPAQTPGADGNAAALRRVSIRFSPGSEYSSERMQIRARQGYFAAVQANASVTTSGTEIKSSTPQLK